MAGIGDFNHDGRSDILLKNGQQLAEWLMNGTAIQAGSGNVSSPLGAGWSVVGTGDFNHDLNTDILLQNGQQLAEWLLNGTAIQAGSGNLSSPLGAGWSVVGTGLFNVDGFADILLQNGAAVRRMDDEWHGDPGRQRECQLTFGIGLGPYLEGVRNLRAGIMRNAKGRATLFL